MSDSSEPYCNHCGYSLNGLVNSSKCPECGKPIVEVLERRSWGPRGRRYASPQTLWGLPLVHIAMGPGPEGVRGRAQGIIAIGDIATGVVALGGVARGVFALGGLAAGLFAFGGLALGLVGYGGLAVGLLASMGGVSIGGVSVGGTAVGLVAQGGLAVGYFADGGVAVGYLARAEDQAYGTYTITRWGASPGAREKLQQYQWLLGPRSDQSLVMRAAKPCIVASAAFPIAVVIFTLLARMGASGPRGDGA